ncbi:hypothetical protein BBJ28_00013939 [Nothophytophthora sp. Chile5]|nr:hypothetical protein BBJ28_00013939 [Nothophytophthora sp. Chile5]
MTSYAMYMDIHVMIFIGFGFLMTYLRKYCLSAVSLNFVVAVMSIQWGVIMATMVGQIGDNDFSIKIIDVNTLIDGDFAAAVVLISFGAVLGKVTPTQLLWMTFFEIIFYAINSFVLSEYLDTIDTGKSVAIHTFGAFFGLALTVQIGVPRPHEEAQNMSSYASDTFAMIGTLFLWVYWPSFNAAMAPSADFRQERAVVNTVLSIAASCAVAFATSQIVTQVKKFDMIHVQNATLAGGVAIGASCDLAISPAIAVTTGLVAGIMSVLGYRFLSPRLEHFLRLSDSAGIVNLHGMPGIFGGLVCALNTAVLSDDHYGGKVTAMYAARAYRSAEEQAGYQLLAVLVTLGIAIISGTMVGAFLSSPRFRQQQMKYDDSEWFQVSLPSDWRTVLSQPSCKEGRSQGPSHSIDFDFVPML